jgi:hypothetical protein
MELSVPKTGIREMAQGIGLGAGTPATQAVLRRELGIDPPPDKQKGRRATKGAK